MKCCNFFFNVFRLYIKIPYWLEYLLRLKVTWLILVAVSSYVRTQERNDVKVLEVPPNCVTRCGQIANAFFCLAVTVFKGCFKTSHLRGGFFDLSYLHPSPGYLIAEGLLWGNASSHDCRGWSRACCLHHRAPALVLQSRQQFLTCAVPDMVVLGSEGFLFFYILHNVSLFILPCWVTVQAGRVAAQRTLQCHW